MDRAAAFEADGWGFESLRARQLINHVDSPSAVHLSEGTKVFWEPKTYSFGRVPLHGCCRRGDLSICARTKDTTRRPSPQLYTSAGIIHTSASDEKWCQNAEHILPGAGSSNGRRRGTIDSANCWFGSRSALKTISGWSISRVVSSSTD